MVRHAPGTSRGPRSGHPVTIDENGRRGPLRLAPLLLPFILLATLNSGGYRYGASDQAFYAPAVLEAADPDLFPRDTALLAAQTRLTAVDDVTAAAIRATNLSLPAAFAILYVLALTLYALGGWRVGTALYATRWTAVALLAALTLRHAIARSGTNTLEGYFHPRTLAYALGLIALGAFLRGRLIPAAILVASAAAVHPTTALWFGVWLAAAAAIARPGLRTPAIVAAGMAAIVALWGLTAGPLAGRLAPMDAEWRALIASKDYLFPLEWPAYAWIFNLAYLPIIAWIYRERSRVGLVSAAERGLVLGSSVLLLIFAGALIGHTAGIALSIQLQPARVFWMFDFLAVVYAVWWVAERRGRGLLPRLTPRSAATLFVALSIVRGIYVLYEAERPPVQLSLPDDDWGRVMAWARTTEKASGWLADPMHAVRYGTSVRVAGQRDVFVEAVKDTAIGMYDRNVAVRTSERLQRIDRYDAMTTDEIRELAAAYDLDYMVTEQRLDLPVVFESGPLRVYRIR